MFSLCSIFFFGTSQEQKRTFVLILVSRQVKSLSENKKIPLYRVRFLCSDSENYIFAQGADFIITLRAGRGPFFWRGVILPLRNLGPPLDNHVAGSIFRGIPLERGCNAFSNAVSGI